MNTNSLRLIEDVTINSGVLSFLEIAQDTIYLDFINVELGNPKTEEEITLSIRFGDNSFIAFFYNDIWDLEFLSDFNHRNQKIETPLNFKVNQIRFLDFEYLRHIIGKYNKNKSITLIRDFNVNNIITDFFLILEFDNMAIAVGANQLNFFTQSEKLDDAILKELSNQWMRYLLEYKSKRNILKKDPICEKYLKEE